MLDIRFIRENTERVQKDAEAKGYSTNVSEIIKLDDERRDKIQAVEKLRQDQNLASKQFSEQAPDEASRNAFAQQKRDIRKLSTELRDIETKLQAKLNDVPNIFPDDTPLGGEENNREEKTWGEKGNKKTEDHLTWGEKTGYIDFERGAKVAGNKFYFLKGPLVELEFAILQLGLKLAKEAGFEPMLVPHMVNTRTLEGAGFSAKGSGDEKQIYKVEDEDLNLIATAEIPMTGYHADETLAAADLPKLYIGFSPAYRMEAGAYGKHSRGLFRVHQFDKLEMYVFCKPEDSEQWHQKLVQLEEKICQELGIPYRLVRIAAGDLGAPAYKKFDIEYYSPADGGYHELMSCSNVTDYQARRLNIRYKADKSTNYVHTLNGTLAAISRMLIAIIENFQTADGKVKIPEALQKYLSGQTEI